MDLNFQIHLHIPSLYTYVNEFENSNSFVYVNEIEFILLLTYARTFWGSNTYYYGGFKHFRTIFLLQRMWYRFVPIAFDVASYLQLSCTRI